MKPLRNIRYILFALIILGCFANFAQNEYGLDIMYYSHLLISFIFFTETVYYFRINFRESRKKAFYLFSEHFLLGLIFLGYYLRYMHLPSALIFVSGTLIILYLIFATRELIRNFKKEKLMSVHVFFFFFTVMASVIGLSFKTLHFPGAWFIMNSSLVIFLLFIIFSLLELKRIYNKQPLSLYQRLMNLPGKPVMVLCYFIPWIIYIHLNVLGAVPNFYNLDIPPASEKLREQKEEVRANKYLENYYTFLENRKNENK